MIYIIGDSHTALFTGTNDIQPKWPSEFGKINNLDRIPLIKTFRISAGTAYNSKSKAVPIINEIIKCNNITELDTIILCFGEVDCRAHLIKQFSIQKIEINKIILECVNRLLETILYYKKKGFNIVGYGPVATFKDENKNNIPVNRYFGNEVLRNKVTQFFNNYYKNLCYNNDIPFFTIFNYLIDSNLKSKKNYHTNDCMHYSTKVLPFILEEMELISLISKEEKVLCLKHII